MKLHRFIGNFKLKPGDTLKLADAELLNQIRSVLKLKISEKIILSDGEGNEGTAEITGYGKDFVEVKVLDIHTNQNESGKYVILYCAVLKKENFELVVQKATEVGVKEIVPIITERTVKLNIRQDRLEKIAKEAAEQSGRGVVPVLREPISFKEAVSNPAENSSNFIFNQSGKPVGQILGVGGQKLSLLIGPEGGWTETELETAKTNGFSVVSLGKTTLRAETAAIIASYISTI